MTALATALAGAGVVSTSARDPRPSEILSIVFEDATGMDDEALLREVRDCRLTVQDLKSRLDETGQENPEWRARMKRAARYVALRVEQLRIEISARRLLDPSDPNVQQRAAKLAVAKERRERHADIMERAAERKQRLLARRQSIGEHFVDVAREVLAADDFQAMLALAKERASPE